MAENTALRVLVALCVYRKGVEVGQLFLLETRPFNVYERGFIIPNNILDCRTFSMR